MGVVRANNCTSLDLDYLDRVNTLIKLHDRRIISTASLFTAMGLTFDNFEEPGKPPTRINWDSKNWEDQ